jgi:hypothetical protein
MLVGRLVRLLVRPSVCPHDEKLRNLLTWKTGYIAIASRRGEGRGKKLMSKTGYVEIASRLVTVARSCLTSTKTTSLLLMFFLLIPYFLFFFITVTCCSKMWSFRRAMAM